MLFHLQSCNDKTDENDSDRIVIETIYIDYCNILATTEEDLSELKAILSNFLHATGLIARASACENTQDSLQHPSPGFINTTSILERTEYSSIQERSGDDCFSTIKVYTRSEIHTAVKWISNESLIDGDTSVNVTIQDRIEHPSQASAVKIDSTDSTDYSTEFQCQRETKTMAKSKNSLIKTLKIELLMLTIASKNLLAIQRRIEMI